MLSPFFDKVFIPFFFFFYIQSSLILHVKFNSLPGPPPSIPHFMVHVVVNGRGKVSLEYFTLKNGRKMFLITFRGGGRILVEGVGEGGRGQPSKARDMETPVFKYSDVKI